MLVTEKKTRSHLGLLPGDCAGPCGAGLGAGCCQAPPLFHAHPADSGEERGGADGLGAGRLRVPGPVQVARELRASCGGREGDPVFHDNGRGGPLPPFPVWLAVGSGLGGNCTGCVICSEDNGCSTCQQRLFLLIRREGVRQFGKCVHGCPLGFFGIRGQDVNRCKRCGSTCDSCFSQDFCIRCKRRFFLHKGKCLRACPPGTLTHQSTRECQEFILQLLENTNLVHQLSNKRNVFIFNLLCHY
ncbi:R-spondin-4 [Fukomys damarensis]|uniref:R-spondin-4 n=1 Tax=Fukomys damarensis TaxID=885580 RepID=UPI001454FADD|nr:R-spondin-4 [Fukomys damarensis]